jgi:hypothetical protein
MTANKVRHSPFSYHIFAMQVEAAIQVTVRKDINFPRKKNTGMYVNKLFSLTVGAVTQKPYYIIAKKIREEFMVFCPAFSNR